MMDKFQNLVDLARPLLKEISLASAGSSAATVAAAILARSGRTYTGVCLHLSCGIGFCAEHASVAEMIKNGETAIDAMVAVDSNGVLSPCGRCRELLVQVPRDNLSAQVVLPGGRVSPLSALLPDHRMQRI